MPRHDAQNEPDFHLLIAFTVSKKGEQFCVRHLPVELDRKAPKQGVAFVVYWPGLPRFCRLCSMCAARLR